MPETSAPARWLKTSCANFCVFSTSICCFFSDIANPPNTRKSSRLLYAIYGTPLHGCRLMSIALKRLESGHVMKVMIRRPSSGARWSSGIPVNAERYSANTGVFHFRVAGDAHYLRQPPESAGIARGSYEMIVESHCHLISPDQAKYPRNVAPNA